MKVVVAPDKFAGTLTAGAAADAIAAGWRRARPSDEVVVVPVADGGEGTLDVLERAVAGAERHTVEVADARGHAVAAPWLALPDGRAFVEAAAACGLSAVPAEHRNPRAATSYGVGQLLQAAVAAGARHVVVGVGGTASVDGGAGLAIALGHRLLRADGNGVKVGGEHLVALERVVPARPLGAAVTLLADVDSPLLGPSGAAALFGPQKGASPDDVSLLETALTRLADVVERNLRGGPWRAAPGAGAGGGLGFALLAFCAADPRPGAAAVCDLVGLDHALRGADVVVTGEGALDATTARGKAPWEVRRRGLDAGARVGAVVGRSDDDLRDAFAALEELGPDRFADPRGAVEAAAARLADRMEVR